MSMAEVGAAVELGRAGHPDEARRRLERLWEQPDNDATTRCAIAHFLADLQESAEDELMWDERALAAASGDDPATYAFFPSLHLSLADVHRRLGHTDLAHEHLSQGKRVLDRLDEGEYGDVVRNAAVAITEALAQGSTAKLV